MREPDRTPRTVQLGATEVHACTMDDAVGAVMRLVADRAPALVVTPNVDHLVLLERDPEMAAAYDRASLRLADGAPLVALARLVKTPLPERVAGIDLTMAVLRAAEREARSVFFFGGAPLVLDRAVERIGSELPDLPIAGTAAPDVDLDALTESERDALARIRATAPDLLIVFLGAPKQEKWFWRRQDLLPPTVALAVGGTVDLLAGVRRRAPEWVQRSGLEWVWRMAQDPRRLAHRYLVRDRAFLSIAARQLGRARRPGTRNG